VIDIVVVPVLYLIKSIIGIAHSVIIADVIFNLLMFVNIININNRMVCSVMEAISKMANIMLNPLRRVIPTNIGSFDVSPILLLLLLSLLNNIVDRIIQKIL
jgi:uncharacterized protein YggT (Ycf19 family)